MLAMVARRFDGEEADVEAVFRRFGAAHPLGRIAEAEEVAEMVSFLAGSRAGFCTGGDYLVDGGCWRGSGEVARLRFPGQSTDRERRLQFAVATAECQCLFAVSLHQRNRLVLERTALPRHGRIACRKCLPPLTKSRRSVFGRPSTTRELGARTIPRYSYWGFLKVSAQSWTRTEVGHLRLFRSKECALDLTAALHRIGVLSETARLLKRQFLLRPSETSRSVHSSGVAYLA